MSKISTYEVAPVPKLSDKLIGTSVGGEIEDITYNFTLLELLELFLPVIPANNLQGVLDYGNTATQDINLFGTITTTNLSVTDTTNLFITYLNEETYVVGKLFDSVDSVGTAGQVLTSTGDGVAWFTLPPIFTPNLQQVLTEGNTADIDILLDANIEALDVSSDTATVSSNLTLEGTLTDGTASIGTSGKVLSSTGAGVQWTDLPVYSATSPLLFDSVTKVFSIQVANSTQGGYLTANDWVTFNGKQDAGAYITALTGEATASGPGSVPITLNNASVIAKVLTGLNVTGGSISASDSILTAFGKVQSQINGLMGGVQYQGVWDAATNNPVLTSSVGVQGHYYIVSVAGSTDLNGITDWKVGDWAIYSGGSWQKVDNTESVTSVNGQVGAVSLTTDNIPEGAVNLYYLNSRARAALSFTAGSGAYNSLTGVITIPTDNNQILNGAGYITLSSLSASAPLSYNNLTGVFSIQQATALQDGYLSAIDWATFNGKQNYLGGTGLVKSTSGTITYITDNSGNWNTAYDNMIVSAAVTGTSTKTLTLNQQDGGTIQASWTDLDTGLTSVGVTMPSAFSVANSPLTANGTIGITGAGTSLQYIDGTGALQTFPGLTGFVPYLGANQNVDLGEYGISAGYFQADLTPTGALQVGRMQWNAVEGTMDLRLMGNNVTLQVGQENVTRVVNKSGVDLLEANYQVVRVRKVAEGGAQGQRLAVVLAQGNNENNSTEVLGLVTETILVNQEGFITAFGEVKQINTTGSLQGETWVDGDILYISTTVPGQLTNIRPVAPNHAVTVGYVTYAHANNGKIYMAIDTGYELGELHNVYAPSPLNNQSIYWNTANSRYELNTIGGILGYTPANDALVVHLAGTETITGQKTFTSSNIFSSTLRADNGISFLTNGLVTNGAGQIGLGAYLGGLRTAFNGGYTSDLAFQMGANYVYTFPAASGTIALVGGAGVGTVTSVAALTLGTSGTDLSSTVANPTTTPVITLNVPTASAANRGALSAADWSTFNTKVGSVTASSPLASSGGQTPNITIQQASGSQDGYLSSVDWATFNNKQAAGNYITSLTGEATASGPGAAAVTLNNASVTAKVLTGINITGGTVQATDTMLTAFGKLQNQINGLIGSTIYQGTWNASTNTPALASGVGVRGYYYIVSVAGTTNLDGITDWFVGDWAIFDGTSWQQVDNTDAVVSVNGQTGAVSLTTDNIPEGATNQYFTQSRARASLSFAAGSGAYNSSTGLITIPTNTNQLTNGASFITLASLSGTAPIVYSNTTGAISITQAGTASNGYLSSTDWNTFNNKQPSGTYVNSVTATGPLASSGGVNPNITIQQATALQSGFLSSSDWVTFNNKQATITLTTTGTSGAATFIGNTLNIPQYQSVITNPVTGTGTANYHAKWVSGSAIGNSLIYDDGTNVGINTTTLTKNINFAGTTKYERVFAYGNYTTNFTNSVGETFTWFRLGNATPFSQTKIFYRAGTSTSEEEGEIKISSTCDRPFIEWTRNTYNYHIREVRGRMTGGCGFCEVWVLVRHGNYNAGTDTNFQWQIHGGTDSSFVVINATGTPGTGTNVATINSTDGYFYNNSGNISILGSMSIGTSSPIGTANLFIEGTSVVLNTEGSAQAKSIYFRYSDGADIRSDSYLIFSTGGTPSEKVRITETGNLGVNTTTPQKKLDIYSGSSNITAASFGNSLSIGEWSGLGFGYVEAGNANYRKAALVFERMDASARGKIHILNNNGNDNSSASLSDARLTIDSTGATTVSAIDSTGNRTNPFNTLIISTNTNAIAPYGGFGGAILFKNDSYVSGVVNSARIRSVVFDDGGYQGGGFIFETTPTAGGALTPTFTLSYTGQATLSNLAGTGTRMVVADASGVLSTQAIGSGAITGSGTTNYLPKFTGASTIGNSAITDDGTTVTLISRGLSGSTATFSGNVSAGTTATPGGDNFITVNNGGGTLYTTRSIIRSTVAGIAAELRTVYGTNAAYFGTTSNSNLYFITNDTVNATLDSAGNFGVGAFPATWNTNRRAIQVSTTASLVGSNSYYPYQAFLANNVYWDSTDTAKYIASSGASYMSFNAHSGGNFAWLIAPAGTAGLTATFTQAMTLSTSGKLGIGITSPSTILYVNGYEGSNWITTFNNTGTSGHKMYFGYNNNVNTTYGLYIEGGLANANQSDLAVANKFYVNGDGKVGVGISNPSTALEVFSKAADADRTIPHNVLTITAEQGNAPYSSFGGTILFKNRSYVSGLVNSSRIRSVIYDDGAPNNFGGGIWFETTPTPGGALTPSLIIDYLGRVGIGTAPSEKLSVAGNIAASGYLYTSNRLYVSGNTALSSWISGSLTAGYSSTNGYGWLNGAGALVLAADGTESIRVSGGLVGINTTTLTKNINFAGSIRHERVYGYGNNFLPIPNSVSYGSVWVHLGTCNPFTTDKIYYRVATNSSEEEGEITISNTCSFPFVQWQRNTYNPMVAQVKARMTGGCGQVQVWLLVRYGTDFGGTNTNLQWQAYNGTDSGFGVVNAIGTPGTGTNEKNIIGSEGYFYANSGSITVAENIGIGTSAPSSKLHIDSALGNDAIRISDTTGSVRMSIGQEASYQGNYINTRNIDMKLQTYLAGGSGGNIIFQTQNNGTSTVVERMRVSTSGEVYIGYTADQGAYLLQVNGSIYASAFFESSDIRLKNIITTSQSNDFGAISFNWKDGRDSKTHWGYSAQDVIKFIPDAIEKNKDGMMTVNYNEAHTWKIAKLEERIKELEKQLNK